MTFYYKLILSLFFLAQGCAHYSGMGRLSGPDAYQKGHKQLRYNQNYQPKKPFRLSWPVPHVKISQGFKNSGRLHQGVDFVGPKNSPIYASHEGLVIYTGKGFRGYGKMIIIEYNKTWATLYAHLNTFKVQAGDQVVAGDLIGLMGKTGRSTGVHLHFELIKDKQPIDPLQHLGNHQLVGL